MFNKKNTKYAAPPAYLGTPFNPSIPNWQPDDDILNEPTVLSCLRLISGSVTSMPLTVRAYDGVEYNYHSRDLPSDLNAVLRRPNQNEDVTQLFSRIVGQLVIYNECFIQVKRGGFGTKGYITQIECLDNGRVSRNRDSNGKWQYTGTDNANRVIISDEIHYLTTTSLGFQTLNPLERVRSVIAVANQSIKHSKDYYTNKPENNGWFVSEKPLQEVQFNRMRDQINTQSQQGGYGLVEGVTFIPNTYSFKDSLSIETRKQTTQDICGVLGVHPALLGLEWASGNSLDEIRSIFLSTTINPIVIAIENFYNRLLLERGYEVDLNESGLLNASYIERSKLALEQYKLGLLTINEARVDMPELVEGGDQRVIESNNLTIGNKPE